MPLTWIVLSYMCKPSKYLRKDHTGKLVRLFFSTTFNKYISEHMNLQSKKLLTTTRCNNNGVVYMYNIYKFGDTILLQYIYIVMERTITLVMIN